MDKIKQGYQWFRPLLLFELDNYGKLRDLVLQYNTGEITIEQYDSLKQAILDSDRWGKLDFQKNEAVGLSTINDYKAT